MTAHYRLWTRALGVALALAMLATPGRSADFERHLPADTETLVVFNIKQLLASKLIQKTGFIDHAKAAIKGQKQIDDVLTTLNFDPFKDLDKVIAAAPGGGQQNMGLLVLMGRFDPDKIKAAAERAAKDHPDVFKIKEGMISQDRVTYYEIQIVAPGQPGQAIFAAVGDKNTIVAAPSQDYLLNALHACKNPTTKRDLKKKDFAALVKTLDDNQTLTVALLGEPLSKGAFADSPFKDTLAKIATIAGGFTVTDGIKMEFVLTAKEAKDAKDIHTSVNNGLKTVMALLELASANQAELKPLLEIAKSIKTTANDKTVTIKGEVAAITLDKLLKKDN